MPAHTSNAPVRAEDGLPPPALILRALREARGVTQQGWAGWLGYSVATVRRWETGGAAPTAEAEVALIAECERRGLFRTYDAGPLRGFTLTPEVLRDALAQARLKAADRTLQQRGTEASPSPPPIAPPTSGGVPVREGPRLVWASPIATDATP